MRRTTWGVLVLSHSLQEDAFASKYSLPARVSSAQSAVGCEELISISAAAFLNVGFQNTVHITSPHWTEEAATATTHLRH